MEKCKICGMRTLNVVSKKTLDDDEKYSNLVNICKVCEGKYNSGDLLKALELGTYGKEKVTIRK